MSEAKKSNGIYWVGSLAAIAAVILMLIYMPAGFWIFLPFAVAFTGKALDII